MKIAISGVGIAGPTLAYWLLRGGHEPTLIESAPVLRTDGYMIDFWGVGYAVAERMGVLPQVHEAGYRLQEVRYVDCRGRTAASISAETMRRELGERFTSLPRGDLAAILYRAVEGRAETILGATITAIEEFASGVKVRLSNGGERFFDLVVGADGLHSKVRSIAFGPEASFERFVGYYVGAFECEGYRPRDELAYVSCGLPARQISRFALRGDRTMFLFVFSDDRLGRREPTTREECKQAILRVYADVEWEWPTIAKALEGARDVYFDRVSQSP